MRLTESGSGMPVGEKLNIRTGFFESASFEDIGKVLRSGSDMDFAEMSREEFIRETEDARSYYLRGEGPIFEIYARINAIYDNAETGERTIDAEQVLALCRRTFRMWGAEAARRAAGQSPAFQCAPVGGR
ncbi:hypothetical protein [Nocardia panacis]|nr:hypothetical protein [Nocardia panacis]